eukprot:15432170-Alexandrium_andersonii.AAC.1
MAKQRNKLVHARNGNGAPGEQQPPQPPQLPAHPCQRPSPPPTKAPPSPISPPPVQPVAQVRGRAPLRDQASGPPAGEESRLNSLHGRPRREHAQPPGSAGAW